EENSIRATARLTDVAINAVVKLLCEAGNACLDYGSRKSPACSCVSITLPAEFLDFVQSIWNVKVRIVTPGIYWPLRFCVGL
ncbi:MAG: hypothetical protein DME81_09275, partial [Verrucomicrobia bacterium]